jgi:RHS repeat-associated protein
VPQTVTPNSAAALSATMGWNGFLGLTSVTPANGNGVSFGYDAYARKTTTTSKDGAQTTYSYGPNNTWMTATTNGRFVKTYFDGIGRAVKVEGGHASTVVSIVETVYEPCACSPVGKVKKVSLPYAPGGTVLWTEYVYDGLGRTLSVIQPNGAGTTTYLYEGNTVKVTSPSGKWKKYEMDALGRLVKVDEPRPGGGTYETSYLYNAAGKLKQVIMPRDGVTQNRYFNYDTTAGTRLLSAQNPENGTVSYSYGSDGLVAHKIDAKGIKTEYSYDGYKRISQMRKLPDGANENRCERVDYFYDENGGNNHGRLTRMRWGWDASGNPCVDAATGHSVGFEESYTHNAAGRTATKVLAYKVSALNTKQLAASWTYDNEGKLLTQSYPARANQPGTNRTVDFSYDAIARLQRVRSSWDWNINTYQDVAGSAVYNHQGALTSLSILGSTETRQYNALGQLTRIQGLGLNIEYRFSATQNDGKITQQKNWVSGEEVTYQYDELERLSSASTTGPEWGLSWSYDGFGNRLAQNLTKGTGPTMTTLVDGTTNRLSGFGYYYDQNGNLTNMPQQNAQMSYDSSNRMVRFQDLNDAESYRYAPDNKRVWRSKGCSYYNYSNGQNEPRPQIIFYSVFGQKMGEYCLMDNVTVVREYVYFGGRMVARSNGGNLEAFKADGLHSNQDAPGGGFFPYGETKSGAATTGESLATYSRDWHGLDYADQRWYSPGIGRFTTADPLEGVFDPRNPLTKNKFSYVIGDPINSSDQAGLGVCPQNYSVSMSFMGITYRTTYIYHCYEVGYLLLIGNASAGNTQWTTQYIGAQDLYESGFCTDDEGNPCYQVDLANRYWKSVETSACPLWQALADECGGDEMTQTATMFMLGSRRTLYFGLGFRAIQITYSRLVGSLAEKMMADLLNLTKNNGQFVLQRTLSGIGRVPDFVDQAGKRIFEVKNVASIALTPQLVDMAAWANAKGWGFTVYVRRGAAGISDLVKVGINVVEMDFPHEE